MQACGRVEAAPVQRRLDIVEDAHHGPGAGQARGPAMQADAGEPRRVGGCGLSCLRPGLDGAGDGAFPAEGLAVQVNLDFRRGEGEG